MKYIDEFRNQRLIREVADKIGEISPQWPLNIMEVCGTHTQSFRRFGLGKLLPENLRFIAGPGCPVCVSSQEYIDRAIELAGQKDTIILTFGDMLRVPGTVSTLEKKRADGASVQVVYSPLDSLLIAKNSPAKKIVFLAVGFETTTPTIALTILLAKKEKLRNLFFFTSLKLMIPAMRYLLEDERLKLQGFLCPGHVSAIIGTNPYEFIPKRYKVGCCVSGFEPLDIIEGVYLLVRQIAANRPQVENQYSRVVKRNGNPKAREIVSKVFREADNSWRGMGLLSNSGLKIRKEYVDFDAEEAFPLKRVTHSKQPKAPCKCADVLKGLILPPDCPLFLKVCSPDNPIGPCMVSSEGACNAYYKYH